MKKILLISYHFRSSNNIAAERTWFLFCELVRNAYDVQVITANNHKLEKPFERFEKYIIRIPDQIENIVRWTDSFEYSHGIKNFLKNKFKRIILKYVIRQELLNVLLLTFFWPGREKSWCKKVYKNVLFKNKNKWTPDLVIASSPPVLTLDLAHRVSSFYRCKWSADYRDLHSISQDYRYPRFFKSLDYKWEKKILQTASLITAVSTHDVFTLSKEFQVNSEVIFNGFDEHHNYDSSLVRLGSKYNLVYTGILYNGKFSPSQVLEALRDGDRKNWTLHYFGKDGDVFDQVVKVTNSRSFAINHGNVERKVALQAQRSADALLLILSKNSSDRGVISGKFFDYLGSGNPILLNGSTASEAAEMILNLDIGKVCNSKKEILNFLNKVENSHSFTGLESNKKNKIKFFSRQKQSQIWVNKIREIS